MSNKKQEQNQEVEIVETEKKQILSDEQKAKLHKAGTVALDVTKSVAIVGGGVLLAEFVRTGLRSLFNINDDTIEVVESDDEDSKED